MGTSSGKAMILSKCTICSNEKSGFIKNQEAKGLLSNLGLRTPLSKVPVFGDICFDSSSTECNSVECNSVR